ncbi:hypothetical protein [Paenibacillus sp. LjRoot56]|uniref:hypothetical protein n=1 Tax=Paenibacillus sp. LjRoot56 TaxID=3342333 RepID=UPI003ECFF731
MAAVDAIGLGRGGPMRLVNPIDFAAGMEQKDRQCAIYTKLAKFPTNRNVIALFRSFSLEIIPFR